MNFRNTLNVNNDGVLEIGGIPTTELAKKYGTPLYVMDQDYIKRCVKYI